MEPIFGVALLKRPVATFFGSAVYFGYLVYEPFSRGKSKPFVPMIDVDLPTLNHFISVHAYLYRATTICNSPSPLFPLGGLSWTGEICKLSRQPRPCAVLHDELDKSQHLHPIVAIPVHCVIEVHKRSAFNMTLLCQSSLSHLGTAPGDGLPHPIVKVISDGGRISVHATIFDEISSFACHTRGELGLFPRNSDLLQERGKRHRLLVGTVESIT